MANPYSPPDVIVTQVRATYQATTSPPNLPVCIIAPCVAIVTNENDGTYTAGSAFSAPLSQLPPGAILTASTFQVLLQAVNAAGTNLGLFKLNIGTDATIGSDNASVTLSPTISLAYSLLNSANNSNNPSADIFGSGVPDANVFTDDAIDFLSLGTVVNSTDVVINSPASIVGTYRIYELIGNGTQVNAVKVQQLADVSTGTPVLQMTGNSITNGSYSSVNGTNLIPGSATTIADIGLISPGGLAFTMGTSAYPNSGGFNLPAATSNDQVVVTIAANPTFASLVAAASIGNWIRIAGDTLSAANGDYQIVAINTATPSITVQRYGQTGSGTITATGGGAATMELLVVLNQSLNRTNGAGDVLTMTIGGVETDFEVAVATPTLIVTVNTITGLTGATPFTIRRGIPFRSATASFDLILRETAGYTGQVLVSYEAARVDVSLDGVIEIGSEQDIIDNFGIIHPDNPIALMCYMVTLSGLTASGSSFYAIATNDNTLLSYTNALETLQSADVYFLVPATQELAVLSACQAHVDAQSQPLNKHERVLFQSTAITTSDQIIPVTAGATPPADGLVTSGTPKVFASASTNWSLVSPGDLINVLASDSPTAAIVETHRIASVNVGSKNATCLDAFSSGLFSIDQPFTITTYPFSKDQQAQDWADYSSSIADFRTFTFRPDVCTITYTDTTGPAEVDRQIVVPTYYAAAAFAGLASSLPPQQPMTNVPLPGVQQLFNSNTYFSPTQLNTIAGGGNLILVQNSVTSAPYAREAVSTDMSSIINKTMSITKDVDFVAKYCRNSLKPYIGNKNITAELLTQLGGICEMLLNGLMASEALLPNSQLVSLVQNPDKPDGVNIVIAINVPYPCNTINVTLQI